MKTIRLRPVEIERDFGQLAALFSGEQDEPTTEPALKVDYDQHQDRIFCLSAAENDAGVLLGFNWATRSRVTPGEAYLYVIVSPEQRRQGAGSQLYADVEQAAQAAGIELLRVSVRDNIPECRAFAERWGFTVRKHQMAMDLDLSAFDDRPYEPVLEKLKGEGFHFTSMGELGDTEETQRKLYALNDMTSSETPGSEGEHSWSSFEDFRQSVCRSDWYLPFGQKIVIDTSTGEWVALSAITRFSGVDYAYNLHTGVDKRYRGRKLGQAVKVTALRFARDVLQTPSVHTHHNVVNLPMIAIDRKFGYRQTPGFFTMEKKLTASG